MESTLVSCSTPNIL
jgi:hypothetical protein